MTTAKPHKTATLPFFLASACVLLACDLPKQLIEHEDESDGSGETLGDDESQSTESTWSSGTGTTGGTTGGADVTSGVTSTTASDQTTADSITASSSGDIPDGTGDEGGDCNAAPWPGDFVASKRDLEELRGVPEILGDFYIDGPEAYDLSALACLKQVHHLSVHSTGLKTLEGLENLRLVENLTLIDNPNLHDLTALSNIEDSDITLYMRDNPVLSSLAGLEKISGYRMVAIEDHVQLNDIEALRNKEVHELRLTSLPVLKDFEPLFIPNNTVENVYLSALPHLETASILGNLEQVNDMIMIREMDNFTSLAGLNNLKSAHSIELDALPALEEIEAIDPGRSGLLDDYGYMQFTDLPKLDTCQVSHLQDSFVHGENSIHAMGLLECSCDDMTCACEDHVCIDLGQ